MAEFEITEALLKLALARSFLELLAEFDLEILDTAEVEAELANDEVWKISIRRTKRSKKK